MLTTETLLRLIQVCEDTYAHAPITAGVDHIAGASLITLPDGSTCLCFRGTLTNDDFQSMLDWMQNFHATLVEAPEFPGKVHAGFLEKLDAIWPAVLNALEGATPFDRPAPQPPHPANPLSFKWWKDLIAPRNPLVAPPLPPVLPGVRNLFVVGHSQGGGLAQLAGVRLAHYSPVVVTFAAPLVGNVSFAADYPSEVSVTRFENDYDCVPFLPFPELGYHPVGDEITRYGWSRSYRQSRAMGEMALALVQEEARKRIADRHGLETGYKPWVGGEVPPPPAAQERIAA